MQICPCYKCYTCLTGLSHKARIVNFERGISYSINRVPMLHVLRAKNCNTVTFCTFCNARAATGAIRMGQFSSAPLCVAANPERMLVSLGKLQRKAERRDEF